MGGIWCPEDKSRKIAVRLREIKRKHSMPSTFEAKWTKVSPSKISLYLDLVDYFFDDDDLHFRGLIVPDKTRLNHDAVPDQNHDVWYYKMYFDMLKAIISPDSAYRIYIDIKDTRGAEKTKNLHDVLSNNMYDYSRQIIERVQLVQSHEIEQLQLADLVIGAISYLNRSLHSSIAKETLVKRIQDRSGYSLSKTTLYRENKVNLLSWHAKEFD